VQGAFMENKCDSESLSDLCSTNFHQFIHFSITQANSMILQVASRVLSPLSTHR
jgi:hypothetical protein